MLLINIVLKINCQFRRAIRDYGWGAGKGRTGVMIAALLMWSGHRKCAMDAMELFTFPRTQNYDPVLARVT